MLEGIDDIDWASIKGNQFGRGPEVAEHLRLLTDAERANESELAIMLSYDGRWAPTTDAAVPFLVELLYEPSAPRLPLIRLFEELLLEEGEGSAVGLDPHERRGKKLLRNKRRRAVYEALAGALEVVLPGLTAPDAELREATADALCWVARPELIAPVVLDAMSTEEVSAVRERLLLCLGYQRTYLRNPKAKGRDRAVEPRTEEALLGALEGDLAGVAATALALADDALPDQAFAVLRDRVLAHRRVWRRGDPLEEKWLTLANDLFLAAYPSWRSAIVDALAELYDSVEDEYASIVARDAVLVSCRTARVDRPGVPHYTVKGLDPAHPDEVQRRALKLALSRPGAFGGALRERLGFLGFATDRSALQAMLA